MEFPFIKKSSSSSSGESNSSQVNVLDSFLQETSKLDEIIRAEKTLFPFDEVEKKTMTKNFFDAVYKRLYEDNANLLLPLEKSESKTKSKTKEISKAVKAAAVSQPSAVSGAKISESSSSKSDPHKFRVVAPEFRALHRLKFILDAGSKAARQTQTAVLDLGSTKASSSVWSSIRTELKLLESQSTASTSTKVTAKKEVVRLSAAESTFKLLHSCMNAHPDTIEWMAGQSKNTYKSPTLSYKLGESESEFQMVTYHGPSDSPGAQVLASTS